MHRPARLTIDLTVVSDLVDATRERHGLAKTLFERLQRGAIELAIAPQGHRKDASGDLARRLRSLIAGGTLLELPQLAYVSEVTFPSQDLVPGHYDEAMAAAWDRVVATWRTHERKPPGLADRFHLETHCIAHRDVFITDDRALLTMCERLRREHDVGIDASDLATYLGRPRQATTAGAPADGRQ